MGKAPPKRRKKLAKHRGQPKPAETGTGAPQPSTSTSERTAEIRARREAITVYGAKLLDKRKPGELISVAEMRTFRAAMALTDEEFDFAVGQIKAQRQFTSLRNAAPSATAFKQAPPN